MNKLSEIRQREIEFGPVAQLGERTVRIREVRGFDPLRVHHQNIRRHSLADVFVLRSLNHIAQHFSTTVNSITPGRGAEAVIVPPCASAMLRAMDSPTPKPPVEEQRDLSGR